MGDDLSSKFNDPKVLAGQLGDSAIPLSSLAVTAQSLSEDNPDSQLAKDKKKRRTFMDIIEAANDYIEQLRKEIDDMENRFYAQDGDAWREKLALKILGEDEIPQRRAGENMDDYRNRLESILITQMLNNNGSIKTRYSNDPELSVYAQWAQKKYHYNEANGYVQELEHPNTSPQRREQIIETLEQNPHIETIIYMDRGLTTGSDAQGHVRDIADSAELESSKDTQSDSVVNEFMKPI